MTNVRIIRREPGLSSIEAEAIFALINAVWPPQTQSESPTLQQLTAHWRHWGATHFAIGDDAILAHGLIFRREIFTSQGPLAVGALATVGVHPDYRGRGWGVDVVRAAFDYLPELSAKVSLFQTGVPQFYEKLGSRVITNPIFDGTRADGVKENPFWDPFQMIYPASFAWAAGEIDLNGSGY